MRIISPLIWKILANFAANEIDFTGEENIMAWHSRITTTSAGA